MAVMQSRDNRTFVAGEDLSAAQFKFVTLEADGQVDLADAAGENAIGVCISGRLQLVKLLQYVSLAPSW